MKLARAKRKAVVRPPSWPGENGKDTDGAQNCSVRLSSLVRCLTPTFSHGTGWQMVVRQRATHVLDL
jgi:hypothetical protein